MVMYTKIITLAQAQVKSLVNVDRPSQPLSFVEMTDS